MATRISITVAEYVDNKVNDIMLRYGYSNKSELVEELIRLGILEFQKIKEGENNDV